MRQILLFIVALLFSGILLANSSHSMPNTVDGCAQSIRILLMKKIQTSTKGTNAVSLIESDIPSNCRGIPIPANVIHSQRPAPVTTAK